MQLYTRPIVRFTFNGTKEDPMFICPSRHIGIFLYRYNKDRSFHIFIEHKKEMFPLKHYVSEQLDTEKILEEYRELCKDMLFNTSQPYRDVVTHIKKHNLAIWDMNDYVKIVELLRKIKQHNSRMEKFKEQLGVKTKRRKLKRKRRTSKMTT